MSDLLTPSQTVGPYFSMRLPWPEGPYVVPAGTPGAITILGRLYDGAGAAIPDGLIETWQADRGPAHRRLGVLPGHARPVGDQDLLPRRGGRERRRPGARGRPGRPPGDADRGRRRRRPAPVRHPHAGHRRDRLLRPVTRSRCPR